MSPRPNLDRYIAGWRGPALAALLALVAGLPGLLLLPPLDRDESRHAQASAQMLESRDFIDIRFQNEPRWNKPVGAYWMQAASVALTSGVENRDIAAYRLPSLLAAMLAAAACAWGGAALFGQRAGFLAGAMLGTTFLLSTEAGIAKTDAILCAAVTIAMVALARIYMAARAGEAPRDPRLRPLKLVFWLAVGIAILVRGAAGLVVIIPAVVALSAWDRDVRWLKRLGWGWGLSVVALIVGPWAIAITVATDGNVWRHALDGGWFAGPLGAEGRRAALGAHTLTSPLLLFPMTLLAPAALATGWTRRSEPAVRFLLCWLVPAWLILEIAPAQPWSSVLPLFGALALLASAAVVQPIGDWPRRIGSGLAIVAAAAICLFTVYGLTIHGDQSARIWVSVTVVCAAVAGAGGAFLLMNRAAVSAVVASIVFGLFAHTALVGALSHFRPLSVAPKLMRTLEEAGLAPQQGLTPGPVAITGFHEPSFVFLSGTDTQLTDAQGAARAVGEGRPAIVEARDLAAFQAATAALGAAPRAVGTVRGFNYSRGEDVNLVVYAPSGAPVAEDPSDRRRETPAL
ncbi:ArnT family glycosyltransferase [Brevundimonas sp.]|uniref:ArnT family glycosyltransferase n=1 Tax=Brevundimonas sp. TaxID=1871086 RepID=UPI003BAAB152